MSLTNVDSSATSIYLVSSNIILIIAVLDRIICCLLSKLKIVPN